MSSASQARNVVIGLIILIIGIYLIQWMAQKQITQLSDIPGFSILTTESVQSIFTFLIYGLAFLTVIMFIVYLSRRSSDKKRETLLAQGANR